MQSGVSREPLLFTEWSEKLLDEPAMIRNSEDSLHAPYGVEKLISKSC